MKPPPHLLKWPIALCGPVSPRLIRKADRVRGFCTPFGNGMAATCWAGLPLAPPRLNGHICNTAHIYPSIIGRRRTTPVWPSAKPVGSMTSTPKPQSGTYLPPPLRRLAMTPKLCRLGPAPAHLLLGCCGSRRGVCGCSRGRCSWVRAGKC